MTRKDFLKIPLIAGGVMLAGSMLYAYDSRVIEISRERIYMNSPVDPLRIVALSDIHTPSFYNFDLELPNLVNAESPDIVIFAGDIIDEQGNEESVRMFKKINARIAKIATLGNWEYQGLVDLKKLRKEYEESDVSLLVNAVIEEAGLVMVGLDDFDRGWPEYAILDAASAREIPVIVVSHCPASFDLLTPYSRSPVVVLSGHTHGGQIAPFGIALVTPRGSGSYVRGWYHRGNHSMYVMRGIGTSGIPLRIGAAPEILVLDIEGAKTYSGGSV